jgi:hypothetical protein
MYIRPKKVSKATCHCMKFFNLRKKLMEIQKELSLETNF